MIPVTDKKTAIFDSTLTLVRENGFHGTPMSQIAKKAGVAAGTIYHHFDSKDTLIQELYEHLVSQMLSSLLQADAEDMEFKERFFNFFISHCLFYIEHPNALFFMEQFVNSPYNSRQSHRENERAQGTFKHLIRYGVKHHLLKPLDDRIICSLVHGTVVSTAKIHLCRKIALGAEELRSIAEVIWDGIRKPAAA